MRTDQTRPFPIVVAVDGSEYSEIVLEHAFDAAARHDAPELHFLAVVEGKSKDLESVQRWLSKLVFDGMESFRQARQWRARVHVLCGDPVEEIAGLAAEVDAGLIVIGHYGGHRKPTAARLIEQAANPILVVGLSGREIEREVQCPQCVATRADSDGERWFCGAHAAPGRMRLSTLVPSNTASRGSIY